MYFVFCYWTTDKLNLMFYECWTNLNLNHETTLYFGETMMYYFGETYCG